MINQQVLKLNGKTVHFVKLSGQEVKVYCSTPKKVKEQVIDYLEGRKDIYKVVNHFKTMEEYDFTQYQTEINHACEFDRRFH